MKPGYVPCTFFSMDKSGSPGNLQAFFAEQRIIHIGENSE
jgi:hypothetical protein